MHHPRSNLLIGDGWEGARQIALQGVDQQIFLHRPEREMIVAILFEPACPCFAREYLADDDLVERCLGADRGRLGLALLRQFAHRHHFAIDIGDNLSTRRGRFAGSGHDAQGGDRPEPDPALAMHRVLAHPGAMETVYDWLTVALFCAIAITYLQRSLVPLARRDPMIGYLPPAIGCAVANWLGNEGHAIWAIALLGISAVYYWHVLKPLDDWR